MLYFVAVKGWIGNLQRINFLKFPYIFLNCFVATVNQYALLKNYLFAVLFLFFIFEGGVKPHIFPHSLYVFHP